MEDDGRGVYSIGGVARMLDVPAATLRTWEERYGILAPQRSPAGQRLYSRAEVEMLRYIKDRVDEGASPADAHRLLEARLASGAVEDERARPTGDHAVLILVAEHDRFAAEFASHLLTTEGYGVEVVLDAAEARRRTEEMRPDLALVELLISGGEGTELCRSLKEGRQIPVVAASSLDLRDEVLAAGADAFLLKPFAAVELLSVLKDLLGESALVRRRAVPQHA